MKIGIFNKLFKIGKILISASIFTFPACAEDEMNLEAQKTDVVKIIVSPEKLSIVEGKTAIIKAEVSPWNANNKTVIWSTSDESVVTVEQNGRVTAVAPGEAKITASAGKVSSDIPVIVKSSFVAGESVSIMDISCLSIKVGESSTLSTEIMPEDATETVVWTSSAPEILKVDAATGLLTAIAPGTAKLTASVSGGKDEIPVLVHGDLWIEQVDPLIKPIVPEKPDFSFDTIRVARGEVATFQGIIYTDSDQGKLTPTVLKFAPEGQEGMFITPELYWVRNIKCTRHWDNWAGGAPKDELWAENDMYPDPLMPVDKWDVSLKGGERNALWVEFPIPDNIPAGLYEAKVRIAGKDEVTHSFLVQIYDVNLPEEQGMDVVNWVHTSLDPMNYGKPVYDKESVNELIEKAIVPFMNKYGQNGYRLNYCGRPFSDFVIEYNNDKQQYEPKFNFDTYEEEIGMYLRACPKLRQIHGQNIIAGSDKGKGTLILIGIKVDEDGKPVLNSEGKFSYDYYHVKESIPEVEAFFVPYFRQLQEFLDSHVLPDGRTWTDIFAQTIFDEPTEVMAKAWNTVAGYVKQEAPKIKIIEPIETAKLDPRLLDYPCPTLGKINTNQAKEGQTQWMYTCMQPQGNYANRFIRIPLIKTRIVHWVNYRYNAKGYLHWGLNYWIGADNKPYENAHGAYLGGDMYIIYPGDREVYPSIRLCAMRDGIKDYDLLKMTEAVSPEMAKEFCSRLVKDNANYNTDVKEFRKLRRDILEYLSK